jgi:hypothetical protein
MRRLLLASLFLLALPASAHATSPYGTFPSCVAGAYALESQTWWTPIAGAPDPAEPGHVHTGACFPLKGTLSGPASIDVVTQLHNNPSKLTLVRWSDGSNVKQTISKSFSCPTSQCAQTDTLTLDPAKFDYSGWREVRITSNTQTLDGNRMYTTTRWCIFVVNGKPQSNYCGPSSPGRNGTAGWYTGVEYMNAYVDDATFPYGPVGMGSCMRMKGDRSTLFVSLDPHWHNIPPDPGRVLYNGAGNNTWRTICLPSDLVPGSVHRVFERTDATGTTPVGTGSGVYTFPVVIGGL